MHHLGKNIRHLRRQLKKTQAELAAIIGKRQTTIGNWENGISEPNIEELLLLSNYFATPLDIMARIDLAQTNWQIPGNTGTEYDPTPLSTPALQEEGMQYILQEIRSIREEISRIKANLP